MTHFNSTPIVNTNIGQTDEENNQGYDRMNRNVLPKHDVPEFYESLNRSSQPIKAESLAYDGPVYHTLEAPDSEPVYDNQM